MAHEIAVEQLSSSAQIARSGLDLAGLLNRLGRRGIRERRRAAQGEVCDGLNGNQSEEPKGKAASDIARSSRVCHL